MAVKLSDEMAFHYVPLIDHFVSPASEELFIVWCNCNVKDLAVMSSFERLDESPFGGVPESHGPVCVT